jgi:hypothetical protein
LCNECAVALDDTRAEEVAKLETRRKAERDEFIRTRARETLEKNERDAQLAPVEQSIKEAHAFTPEHLELLKTYPQSEVCDLYSRLCDHFVKDRELDDQDLQTLLSLQQATGLTDNEIRFEQFVKPYYYINSIRNEGTLPTVNLQIGRVGAPILRRGEVVHYRYNAAIIDTKKLQGAIPRRGAQGTDFRLTNDVKYRVGAFARGAVRMSGVEFKYSKSGESPTPTIDTILEVQKAKAQRKQAEQRQQHAIRETEEQSYPGTLFITNNRVFLQPEPGNKPVSIALSRILTFNCFSNAIEIWQEGREQAYLFWIPNSGAVEIFGLCLIFLLDEGSQQYAETETNPFRRIPTEVKTRVLARDGHCCVMCGSSDGIHFDHIIPVSKGGDNTEDNIQILCKECNLRKYNKII